MTLPIDFAPTPVTENHDPADAEDAFGDVATTTDANFAKINTFLRGDVAAVYASTQTTALTQPVTGRAFTAYPPEHWAPLSVQVPLRCSGLMIGVGARGLCDGGLAPGWLGVSFNVTGATSWVVNPAFRMLLVAGQWLSCGVSACIRGDELTPGGTVTITPTYYWESDNGSPGSGMQEYYGHLWALAFV